MAQNIAARFTGIACAAELLIRDWLPGRCPIETIVNAGLAGFSEADIIAANAQFIEWFDNCEKYGTQPHSSYLGHDSDDIDITILAPDDRTAEQQASLAPITRATDAMYSVIVSHPEYRG